MPSEVPDFIRKYLDWYKSDARPTETYAPWESYYSTDGTASIPFNKDYLGIIAHELAHSTSPIMNMAKEHPEIGGAIGLASALAMPAIVHTTSGPVSHPLFKATLPAINKLRAFSGQPVIPKDIRADQMAELDSNSIDRFKTNVSNAIKHKAVLYGLLGAYAPRFAEETLTNARAAYALFKNESFGEALSQLPQLAVSQASYTLPAALAIWAHRSLNAPKPAYSIANRLASAFGAVKDELSYGAGLKSYRRIIDAVKFRDKLLKS